MNNLRALLRVSALLLLAGCSGARPFDYHRATEIPQGPGLFSGEDGVFETPSPDPSDAEPDKGT